MTQPASRPLYLLSFILCLVLLAVALYMEHVMGLEPCPLCIVQRVVFIVLGLISLAAMLHNPTPGASGKRPVASRVYGLLITLTGAFGVAIAGRQVWLQHQPADQLPSCLPSLDYMMDVLPFQEMLRLVFSGTADCAAVTWTFLGLSIAEYTLIAFIGYVVFGLLQLLRRND